MRGANAGIKHVDVHSCTRSVPRVHSVERQIMLVDAVQSPRWNWKLEARHYLGRDVWNTIQPRSNICLIEVCNLGGRYLRKVTAIGRMARIDLQWCRADKRIFHRHTLCRIPHGGVLVQQTFQFHKRCLDADHRQTVLRRVALEEQFAPCWQLLYDVLQLRIRPMVGDLYEPIPALKVRSKQCARVCPARACLKLLHHLPLEVHGNTAH
mmetsp:Transcript_48978/g.140608  ORF Transcript_48978/g.140608 Transcript_48978/m.140608 type:complete len:209 (+) Transcript_48978:1067-1693(+)